MTQLSRRALIATGLGVAATSLLAGCDTVTRSTDVRAISRYVAELPGGRGAARELIEAVMKAQGRW